MDDDDLIRVALRAALDHILKLDGERPLTDAEWDERPENDPELFAALVSAGRVALSTARSCGGMAIAKDIPRRHLRVGPGRIPGHVRIQHIPTGAVVEVSHITPQVDASLAVSMVRAAFDHRL